MSVERPSPVLWLYYQYGGRLPERYRDWVLRDATRPSWMLRVCIRGMVQIAPLAIVLLLLLGQLGGSWPLALGSVLLGLLVVGRIVVTSAVDSVDARLMRHGFPPKYGSEVRSRLDEAAIERYNAIWRNPEQ